MLVLTRKLGESVAIEDGIKITVVQIKGGQVRLAIKAPKETKIHREEIHLAIQNRGKLRIPGPSKGVTSVLRDS